MQYINLGILLITLGFVIGVYVHTDKKIAELSERTDKKITELSDRMDKKIDKLSEEIKENNKYINDRIDKLSDRIDRLFDVFAHMGFRDIIHKDK
jgi:ribosomal protein S13